MNGTKPLGTTWGFDSFSVYKVPVGTVPRVADQVHFRPDPDPANHNFKKRIRILLALTKNQFKHLNFVHINQISSDI